MGMKTEIIRKVLLACLSFFSFFTISKSQPVNDICESATEIEAISDAAFMCTTGTTLNALPEDINNSCGIGDFPTVWFHIQPDGSASLINIHVSSTDFDAPVISLFYENVDCSNLIPIPLTQSNLPCIVGSSGVAEAIASEVGSSESYYIAITSLNSAGGEFELCVNTISVGSACVVNRNIEITSRSGSGPLTGPFLPGETIGVCMNVQSFTAAGNGCQWFQGIIPVFGNGWDPSSFDADGQPLNATINGNPIGVPGNGIYANSTWDWFSDVGYHHNDIFRQIGDIDGNGTLDMCSVLYEADCPTFGGINGGCCGPCWDDAGDILPPGWFAYGINGTCGTPGPPVNVDWGDGNTCGAGMGPWSFCFELTTRSFPFCLEDETTRDLTLAFFTFADGETGSWTGGASVCALDQPAKITFPMCCSTNGEDSETLNPICSGGIFEYIIDVPGVDYWQWSVDAGNVTGAHFGQGNNGSIISDTLTNTSLQSEFVVYTFTGFATGSCSVFEQEVTIEVFPTISVSLDPLVFCTQPVNPIILNAEVTGGTGNYEYTWIPSGETTPSITITDPVEGDEFIVIVTDELGCTISDSTIFMLSDSFPVSILASVTEQCLQHGPIILEASASGGMAPFTFQWTLPDGSIVISDTIAAVMSGIYVLEATDTEGCAGTDSVLLTLYDPEVLIITGNGQFDFCEGDSLLLSSLMSGGEEPYTYVWDTPEGMVQGDTIVAITSGAYSVTASDVNGCVDSDDVIVSEIPVPMVDLGPDSIDIHSLYVLDAGPGWAIYQWGTGGNTQTDTINASGNFWVCVTDIFGCVGCDTIYVNLVTNIIQLSAFETIGIYPNPNKGEFTITLDLDESKLFRLRILDPMGSTAHETQPEMTERDMSKEIILKNAVPGVYIIQIYLGNDMYVGRIVVQ